MLGFSRVTAFFILFASAPPVLAQDVKLPYWASIQAEIVNMRVGPGTSYSIDWVYRRVLLPVRVTRREEGWRLVEDSAGTKGWMLGQMLSRDRGAIVTGEGLAEMHKQADSKSPLLWRLETGVVVRLLSCKSGWCNIALKGHKGFVRHDRLWGPGKP
jgi:SH3-like domain-containing protein